MLRRDVRKAATSSDGLGLRLDDDVRAMEGVPRKHDEACFDEADSEHLAQARFPKQVRLSALARCSQHGPLQAGEPAEADTLKLLPRS